MSAALFNRPQPTRWIRLRVWLAKRLRKLANAIAPDFY